LLVEGGGVVSDSPVVGGFVVLVVGGLDVLEPPGVQDSDSDGSAADVVGSGSESEVDAVVACGCA
jgi:hypothetical protein